MKARKMRKRIDADRREGEKWRSGKEDISAMPPQARHEGRRRR